MYAAVAIALIAAVTTRFLCNKYFHKARVDHLRTRDDAWTAAQRGDATLLAVFLSTNDAFRFAQEPSGRHHLLQLLRIAVRNDHVHAVKVICGALKSCMWRNPPFQPQFGLAARSNQDGRVIAVLVNANACVNQLWDGCQSALHTAANYDNCGGMGVLIRLKADVNANAMNYGTPLHFAAFKNNAAAAQLLLDHGARTCVFAQCIIQRDLVGTPLDWAQHCGNAATARVLKQAMRIYEKVSPLVGTSD